MQAKATSIHELFTPQDHYQENGQLINGEDEELQRSLKEDISHNFIEIGSNRTQLSIPSLDDETTLVAGSSANLPSFKLHPLYPATTSDSLEPAASIARSVTSSSTIVSQLKDCGIKLPHLDENDKTRPLESLPQVRIKQKACPQA